MKEIRIYDLENCATSIKNGLYGGAAGSKDGIMIGNDKWMVKYPKATKSMDGVDDISYTTSPICEYLGSHVYQILGYETHDTILGIRHDKLVVACKDFTDDGTALAEIRTIKNHANEILSEKLGVDMESTGDTHHVNLENLMLHIRNNPILAAIPGIEERFFEQAIIDIYINNSDRNNGNWGILRHSDGTPDTIAPIFDNGGSFQSRLSDERASRLLENIPLAQQYACGTQTAYADKDGRVYSALRFLELRHEYPKLNEALLKVTPLIEHHRHEINKFIDAIPLSIKNRDGKTYEVCGFYIKELYKLQLDARFSRLLQPEHQKVLDEINLSKAPVRRSRSMDYNLER